MTKDEITEQLKRRDIRHLLGIDERLYDYVYSNIHEPEKHNYYEIAGVLRFLRFFDKYEFRVNELRKFVVFYEDLQFKGNKGPAKYELTPVQVFQFASILCFFDSAGYRVCRSAMLFVPRKFSKTTSVASLAIYDLMFGDYNAECYTGANSFKQAQVCFKMIKYILKRLDPRGRSFRMIKESVFTKRKGRESLIECLSTSADKLDGLNCSVAIIDEFSQADNADLKNVLTSSMGARENPLTVIITTASEKQDTPFCEQLRYYQDILSGKAENDSVFASLFMPDEGDEDYGNPALWYKVHPHLGITVNERFYHDEWKKAQSSATEMRTFMTKLLNVFCNIGKEWLSSDVVRRVIGPIDLSLYRGVETMVSVDLSVCDDFSVVSYMVYDRSDGVFKVKNEYYIPRATINNHPNGSMYKDLVSRGYLNVIEGEVIDYDLIVEHILEKSEGLNILQIGYDPYKSLEFTNMITAMGYGNILVPVKQTISAFTAPTEITEKLVHDKKILIDDNPLNAYCFNNVQIVEDSIENRKPMKKSENAKIDGVITIIMNVYLFNNYIR